MAACRELSPERDRRERMAGLAEGRQQEPPPAIGASPRSRALEALFGQSDSASARMISERPSAVGAIGLVMSVPTPASRYTASRSATRSFGPHRHVVSMSSSGSAAAASSFLPAR